MARPRLPRVPEKVEQAQIVRTLHQVGGAVYVLGTRRPRGDYQGTRQTPGIPDLLAFVPVGGRSVQLWVEVKARGGRVRPEQAVFADRCRIAEQAYVRGGLDAVLAWLIERGVLRSSQVPHYRRPETARTA